MDRYWYGRPPPDINGMCTLKVDNLTYRTTPEALEKIFSNFGHIGDIYIPRNPFSKESRGFAFVRYFDSRDAEDAMHELDGTLLDGRSLRVQIARYGRPMDLGPPKFREPMSFQMKRRRSLSSPRLPHRFSPHPHRLPRSSDKPHERRRTSSGRRSRSRRHSKTRRRSSRSSERRSRCRRHCSESRDEKSEKAASKKSEPKKRRSHRRHHKRHRRRSGSSPRRSSPLQATPPRAKPVSESPQPPPPGIGADPPPAKTTPTKRRDKYNRRSRSDSESSLSWSSSDGEEDVSAVKGRVVVGDEGVEGAPGVGAESTSASEREDECKESEKTTTKSRMDSGIGSSPKDSRMVKAEGGSTEDGVEIRGSGSNSAVKPASSDSPSAHETPDKKVFPIVDDEIEDQQESLATIGKRHSEGPNVELPVASALEAISEK